MSRWRIILCILLVALPFLALMGLGSYLLWQTTWGLLIWVGMVSCIGMGYLLALRWHKENRLLKPVDLTAPAASTARDKKAWKLIQDKAEAGMQLPHEQLAKPEQYLRVTQDLALELARLYHPKAVDPVAYLTIPEILTVAELAAHDLSEMVDKYLPGGHLLTIQDWRRAQKATTWYKHARNVFWGVSAIFNPVGTGIRFLVSRVGLSVPLQLLQDNLLLWFYTAYLQRLGAYLIELNSGRLRVGAEKWREIHAAKEADEAEGAAAAKIKHLTLSLLGRDEKQQRKLAHALLPQGAERVEDSSEFRIQPEGIETELVVKLTPGLDPDGPSRKQRKSVLNAAEESDLLLLLLDAKESSREPETKLLKILDEWAEEHPEMKRPPIIGVLTDIDELPPEDEWEPPYNWLEPTREKEKSIAHALEQTHTALEEKVEALVPVCLINNHHYGIEEGLLPAIATLLDEAHGVALLRVLREETKSPQVTKVFHQLVGTGKTLAKALWDQWRKKE